jgi:hypothetical protein
VWSCAPTPPYYIYSVVLNEACGRLVVVVVVVVLLLLLLLLVVVVVVVVFVFVIVFAVVFLIQEVCRILNH